MIKILGTRGEIEASSPTHKKHSGVLIDNVLFDLGEQEYLEFKPSAIFITHLHPDHAFWVEKKTPTIELPQIFHPENIKLLEPMKINGMTITSFRTTHSKKVRSVAYLIEKKGVRILYTGDMIWIRKKYHPLINDCDLVITEGSSFDKDLIRRDKTTGEIYGHSSIPKLVKLFKGLNAKNIVITHFGKWLVEKPEEGYKKIKDLSDEKTKVWAVKDGEEINLEDLAITTEVLPKTTQIIVGKIKEVICPVCNLILPSKEEMLKHLKEKHPEEWRMLKEFLDKPIAGLYLVSPHGRLIWERKKTLIIKSKRFIEHTEEPLYLIEDGLCYGIISMAKPVEISPQQFRELRSQHFVTDEEAFKHWGWHEQGPLYAYEVKVVELYKEPRKVKIPQGVQVFVNAENIEFLAQEKLIADWKSYNPKKLIRTKAGRRVLADDHRIVHTWFKRLQNKQAMKSPQFRDYSLEEQKKIVKELHDKIVEVFKTLSWKHRTPLSIEDLKFPPEKAEAKDLEDIDDQYVVGISDKDLRVLYYRLHWLYHNVLKKITEPLHNAHVFVWKEIKDRNMRLKLIGDKLDRATALEVVEYPKPEIGSKSENAPTELPIDEFSTELPLDMALEAFPDLIVLKEDPVHVYICGRLVNTGISPKGHDVDILFKQGFSDARILHSFVEEVSKNNKDLGRRLHFVWDPYGPEIGYSVPLYRLAYKRVTPEEMKRTHPKEYLGQTIQVMRPYRQLKPKSGFHKHEFFDVQEFWDKWGAENIDKGLIIQKKYDGMRFQVHVKGDQIKIITEDEQRDRASIFKESVKELLAKKKTESFVLDAEMVEYNCFGKEVKDKEGICEPLKREQMIPWVTATKKELQDAGIVFHIHDCVYFNGEDIHEKGYEERWNTISKCFPEGLEHWRRVPGTKAETVREFFSAIRKERTRPGSEGVVAKIKDSIYKMTGRTGDWAKLKNLKEIDVMVWDIEQKKTKEGVKLNQWIYYPVFLIPCNMKNEVREDQWIEHEGKCYSRIGRAYGTSVRCQRGDIITVRPVQIVENKDPKTEKKWWSWMFPFFEEKKTDKNEPDTFTTVQRIVKIGTAPLPEQMAAAKIIRLPLCPYWNDPEICTLRERFFVPKEDLALESVLKEYLKFPVMCTFANRFKCHFVKPYYYELKEIESDVLEIGEEDDDEEE